MLTALPGGHLVDPFNPRIFMPLSDVLAALDNICRYCGRTSGFYSVLNHSVTLASLFQNDPYLARQALVHDFSEAYIGDISGPVKKALPGFAEMERKLDRIVWEHYGGFTELDDFELVSTAKGCRKCLIFKLFLTDVF